MQSYSSITQEHTHAYTEPCVFPAYSETWQIPITKYIQVPRHIHNTILNIFTIPPSWTFDTVLHASVFRTGRARTRHVIFQAYSATVIFAHIEIYLGRLRHIQNPGTVRGIFRTHGLLSQIFRTVDIFSQFQAHCYGITQEQFMHVLKLM